MCRGLFRALKLHNIHAYLQGVEGKGLVDLLRKGSSWRAACSHQRYRELRTQSRDRVSVPIQKVNLAHVGLVASGGGSSCAWAQLARRLKVLEVVKSIGPR